jgi:hypothetical protein
MRRPPVLLLVLASAALALSAACGHRGDPLPPRRRTPPPPQEFRVAQRGDALEVSATAPAASVDGVPYEAVSVEFLWADGQQDLEKGGRRRMVAAKPGARVVDTLPLPAAGATVRVAARALAAGRKGQRTLTVALVARTPLEPPSELTATVAHDGVALSWHGPRPRPAPAPAAPPAPTSGPPAAAPVQPPPSPAGGEARAPGGAKAEPPAAAARGEAAAAAEAGASPEGPRTSGFFVYRRVGSAVYGAPLTEEPLERRGLTDALVPLGAKACYVVRAVASTQPLVESTPSNEACAEMRDIAPPAAPAGLAVLPREGGLEILWSPSAESDLAGYRVYRAAPGAEPERVAEVAAGRASWLDESAQRGVAYRYQVTAVDPSGNESERTEPVEAALP